MQVERENELSVFRKDLKEQVLNHPVMRHPFWSRFSKGGLKLNQLQIFGLHYYQHVKRTRLYAAAILSRTPFEEIQSAISSVLWDEYGLGDKENTHPAQFRKMLRALKLVPVDWDSITILPELEMYSDVHHHLCSDEDIWVGLGVVGVAMELPIPVLYEHLVEGFLKSGLKEGDLQFFVEHGPMDVRHAGLLLGSMEKHIGQKEVQASLAYGVRRSLDARSVFMDGLYRVVYE